MKDKGRFAGPEARRGPLPQEVRSRYRSTHGVAVHACVSEEPPPMASPNMHIWEQSLSETQGRSGSGA
jgi:hypothetical protein